MSDIIWVAIIGVVGTILGSLFGFLSNRLIEIKRVKNDTRQYVSKAQFDLQLTILRGLSKAFFKVLVIFNTVEKEIKAANQDRSNMLSTCKRLTKATSDAQDYLFENAPFLPESIYEKYDRLNNTISNLFWDYYDFVTKENETKQKSSLEDITSFLDLIEYYLRDINSDIRKLLSNTSIIPVDAS